jgi:hypothetical protein
MKYPPHSFQRNKSFSIESVREKEGCENEVVLRTRNKTLKKVFSEKFSVVVIYQPVQYTSSQDHAVGKRMRISNE